MSVSFRLLAAGLLLALTIPRMTQPGMFSDGVLYASIARNMAEGTGSFWAPAYTKTIYPVFREHPPLGLGLEAAMFAIAGDHPYVERAYSLIAGLATALLIVLLWRCVGGRGAPNPRGDWLPLLFWLLPSTVTWSVVNNMLENTQAVFTTAAVLTALLAVTRAWIWSVPAGVLVMAAVLTKGPVGLFPACVPLLYALIVSRERMGRAMAVTAIMAGVLALAGAALIASPPARLSLQIYLHTQVLASIAGGREVADSRWRFVELFGLDILARMSALLLVIWAIARGAQREAARVSLRPAEPIARFFLCVALAASLPIALSPKLMGHYLVPSIPMFAMAFALFAWPVIAGAFRASDASHNQPPRFALRRSAVALAKAEGLRHAVSEAGPLSTSPLIPWREPSWLAYLPGIAGVLLIILAFALPFTYGPIEERDVTRLLAMDLIGPSLSSGEVVRTCPEANNDWPLHAYMQRFFRVSLDAGPTPHEVFLRVTDRPCEVPQGCTLTRFAGDLEMYVCSQ